jgi:oligosaccharide repeat unit polymerase
LKIPLIIFFWIFGLCFLSNFSIGGLYPVTYLTDILVGIGLIGYIFGISFYGIKKTINDTSHVRINKVINSYNYLLYLIFPFILILLLKFIILIISDPSAVTRQALYGNSESHSILFGSQAIELLYIIFIASFIKVLVIIGFYLSIQTKKIKFLLISNLIFTVDSIIFLGRGFILEFIFQFIFLIFIYKYINIKFSKFYKLGTLFIIIFLIFFGSIMSKVRGDSDVINLTDFFYSQVVNYHTVGFVILDNELNNNTSPINISNTYGLASLGVLERIVVLIIRRFDKSIDSVSGQNGEYLAEFRALGYNANDDQLNYNAFGTIFYTFYQDGGFIFVFFGMLIYGFFLSKAYYKVRCGNDSYIPFLYLLFQMGFNSVFFSPLESSIFWIVVILLFLFRYISLSRYNKLS